MSELERLKDPGSERALLSTIIKNGKDAIIDSGAYLNSTDFSLSINRNIFLCLQKLADNPNCQKIDVESIQTEATGLGMDFSSGKEQEYLQLLSYGGSDSDNIPLFCLQIKKYSVARDLYQRYDDAKKYLASITGQETLSEILRKAEGSVVDFVTGVDGGQTLTELGNDIIEHVEEMIGSEPVDQVGLPTGFPLFDKAIGGGPRPGTITVTAARAKRGKSYLAINKACNIASRGIPVLYLDTELTKEYQQSRLMSIVSGCPIADFETRKFNKNRETVERVRRASHKIAEMPLTYESVAGMGHTEAIALARRWLIKKVGFNEKGEANPCVIIYDYLKLTSGKDLSKFTPEYILLGLMLTELHNFAVRYMVPIIGYVQLNREGIDSDDTGSVAGSDRILWLCSSMSYLRDKDETDVDLGCGWDYGNKKLLIIDTRQGAGLEYERDYINIRASLRPRVSENQGTGKMIEGLKFSDIVQTAMPNDRPGSNTADKRTSK